MGGGANEVGAMGVGGVERGTGVRVDKVILSPHFWGGECPNTLLSHGPIALTRRDLFSMNHLV